MRLAKLAVASLSPTVGAVRSNVSRVIEVAHEMAAADGAAGVLLETQISNAGAQALYEKLGYQRNDSTWFYWLPLQENVCGETCMPSAREFLKAVGTTAGGNDERSETDGSRTESAHKG